MRMRRALADSAIALAAFATASIYWVVTQPPTPGRFLVKTELAKAQKKQNPPRKEPVRVKRPPPEDKDALWHSVA